MIVVVIGSAGLLASGVIRSSAELDITSLVAFSAPGGLLLITLPSYAIAVVHARYSASLVLVIALLMSALGAFLWSRRVTLPRTPTLCRTALAAFMISILLLRLAFAGDLVLPMYSDSVEHVLLIRDLLQPDMPYRAWHSVSTLLTNYYHIGSHAVSAWMLSATGAPSPANVLTIGQFMQAVTIGGLYFPVYAATKRSEPACCATLLGGVGWMMPGYASNWGKYPAMFGVAALPGVLGLIILAGSSGDVKRRPLRVLACLSIASAAVLHTRIVVVVGAFVLALIAGKALDRSLAWRGTWDRSAVVCATAGAMGAAWASLQPHFTLDALGDLLTWYSKPPGLTSSLIALALLPFALRSYRRQTLVAMCFLLFLVLARSVPPYQDLHLPLLDGPIADMVVWLPLAAIGGLGVSGISESLRANWRHQLLGAIARVLPGVFFTAYCAWALTVQQDNPSECCITARGPDVEALNWALGHLPVNARVLIASEVRSASYSAAVDGGAWLEAVAERETIMESGSTSLTSPVVLSRLCDAGVTHVYFGGSNGSFNRLEVDLAPDLYSRSFATQGAAIYSINGCSDA